MSVYRIIGPTLVKTYVVGALADAILMSTNNIILSYPQKHVLSLALCLFHVCEPCHEKTNVLVSD